MIPVPQEMFEDMVDRRGLSYLQNLPSSDTMMTCQAIKLLGLEGLRLALLTSESRLFCNDYTQEKDAETLIKVLTELREYDRAICLAREARTCLYYPVMKMMSEYC
jgi:hypothetical protein